MPFVPHKCHLNTFIKDRNSLDVLNPRVVVVVQVFLACAPCKCCRLIFFYCAVFCWLNWTANQSCFSPLCLFFHPATERGRCAECRPIKKKTCLLQIIVQKWSRKTGRNVSSKGFKHTPLWFLVQFVLLFSPLSPLSLFAAHLHCHSAGHLMAEMYATVCKQSLLPKASQSCQ